MRRGRLSQRVKNERQHPVTEPTIGWRVLHWFLEHELVFILCGGFVFALLALIGHATLGGPADALLDIVVMLWICGVFVLTVLVMDENPKYRKSGAWICAAVGAVAGGALAWLLSGSPEWVAAGLALGALLGATKPVWLFHLL